MPKIRVYPDALRAKANELILLGEDQREVIRYVSVIMEDLADWEGEAQKAFMQAFANVKPVYERFSVDIYKFANHLVNYANTMEYIDISAGEAIRNRRTNIPGGDRIVGPGLPLQ